MNLAAKNRLKYTKTKNAHITYVRFDLSLNSSLIRNDIIFYDSVGFRPDRWEDDTFTHYCISLMLKSLSAEGSES